MAVNAIERGLMNLVRPMQLERRRASTSWSDVAYVNRSLGPTLDITFDKLDTHIPVARWRTGHPALGQAELVTDTGKIKAFFYGNEYAIPWHENWLRERMQKQPNTSVFGATLGAERYNLERMGRRLVGEIERAIDADFYGGNSKIEFPGMVALDGAPTALGNGLATAAGRKEFIQSLVAEKSDTLSALTHGSPVLAIDHKLLPYLALPPDPFAGTTTPESTLSFVQKLVSKIVPVQNTALGGKALLHYNDPENVEVFDLTPSGVQMLVGEPRRGEDVKVRMFAMWTAKEYRADSVKVFTGL